LTAGHYNDSELIDAVKLFLSKHIFRGCKVMNRSKRQKEFDFKRSLIIEAAKKIFFEKGFEAATIDDIAKEADYSKGSIYSYFNSKNEICFSIINPYFENILTKIKDITQSDKAGIEKLISIKEQFINDFSDDANFCSMFDSFRYHRGECSQLRDEMSKNESINEEINQCFESIIQEGKRDKTIKESVDSQKLANAFWNSESSFVAELRHMESNSYDYIFNLIIQSILA